MTSLDSSPTVNAPEPPAYLTYPLGNGWNVTFHNFVYGSRSLTWEASTDFFSQMWQKYDDLEDEHFHSDDNAAVPGLELHHKLGDLEYKLDYEISITFRTAYNIIAAWWRAVRALEAALPPSHGDRAPFFLIELRRYSDGRLRGRGYFNRVPVVSLPQAS